MKKLIDELLRDFHKEVMETKDNVSIVPEDELAYRFCYLAGFRDAIITLLDEEFGSVDEFFATESSEVFHWIKLHVMSPDDLDMANKICRSTGYWTPICDE